MEAYGKFIYKYRFQVVVFFLLVAAGALWIGVNPGSEDDVLKFLPRSNPIVERFYDVNERFGALHVAMVAIKTDNVFRPEFIEKLDQVTNTLRDEVKGVHRVLSLTNVADFALVKGEGLKPHPIVDPENLPKDEAGWKKLAKDVLAKDHVVGQFVSADGSSAVILCFLSSKGNVHDIVSRIRKTVRTVFPKERIYWGGTPFISSYIFAATEKDLHRLTPWAVGLIIVFTFLVFRDFVGVLLTFVATIFGGLVAFSVMKLAGAKVNLVLGSMPVILFAVGSAYGIHFLVRYYHLRERLDTEAAIAGAFADVGPAILAAGLTTIAGFASFLAMDMVPMQHFGLYTGLGIFSCLAAALAFVPAVLAMSGRTRKGVSADSAVKRWVGDASSWAYRHRGVVALLLVAVGAVGFYYSLRVKLAVETSQFFTKGSEPDRAERFFEKRFGGAMYAQIHFTVDLDDPAVLREIRRLSEKIRQLPYVSSVQHIAMAYELVNQAMVEMRRIPDTRKQVQTLSGYVLSDPSAKQLMTMDHKEALIHIKISTSHADKVDATVAQIRSLLHSELPSHFVVVNLSKDTPVKVRRLARQVLASQTADHLIAVLRAGGVQVPKGSRDKLAQMLARTTAFRPSKEDVEAVSQSLVTYFRSKEVVVPLPPAKDGFDPARALADALAGLGPGSKDDARDEAGRKTLVGHGLAEDDVLALTAAAGPYLDDAWKLRRGESLLRGVASSVGVGIGSLSVKMKRRLQVGLLDMQTKRVAIPGPLAEKEKIGGDRLVIGADLTGMPVLYEGLAKSVQANQIKSLVISGILVLLVIGLIFRSGAAALVGLLPAGLTVMMVFGYLGFRGLYLDTGTSMIASIALGVGIDYAIHYLVWWRRAAQGEKSDDADAAAGKAAYGAAHEAGTSILVNALMVAAAFVVLTMGDAAPMKNFGGMTAASMIVAALAAFAALPALAGPWFVRRWAWAGGSEGKSGNDSNKEVSR